MAKDDKKGPEKQHEKPAAKKEEVKTTTTAKAPEKSKENIVKIATAKAPENPKENVVKTTTINTVEKGKENVVKPSEKTFEKEKKITYVEAPVKRKRPVKRLPKKGPAFLQQAPIKVSPVVKLGRYTFLLLGIFYGVTKNKYYTNKEKSYQQRKALLEEAKKEALNAEKEP